MLSPPGSAHVAGLEAVVVAAFFLSFGYLLADTVLGRRDVDAVVRWGLALPALAGYALALTLLHMASGGRVLSDPWLVRALTVLPAAALAVRKALQWRRAGRAEAKVGPDGLAAAGMTLLVIAVWSTPIFRLLPLDRIGQDIFWHMGLATQVMNGQTTPSATVTGAIPNYYPWLYHSMVAMLAWLTPGERAYDALNPLQLLQVAGSALSLFALGREITKRWLGGAAAALLGGAAGGFGFVLLRSPDVVLNARQYGMEYLGDLLYTRSYNATFANITPPYPRDLALTLLLGALLLLVLGLNRRSTALLVGAGAVLGMCGLTGGEAFVLGMGVAVAISAFPPRGLTRRRVATALLGPAAAVAALWYVPLAVSYVRLGGFVNITRVGAVSLTPVGILVSWGVAVPLGAWGLARWIPRARRDPGARVALALLVVATVWLASSAVLGGGLGGALLSLSRRHRQWPLLQLAVALYGALGLPEVIDRAARWRRGAGAAAAAVILAVAVVSPVAASLAVPGRVGSSRLLGSALRGNPSTMLNVIAPRPGMRCVAAVPPNLEVPVFAYTGYRLVLYRWYGYTTNLARIRWRDIYQHIPGDAERLAANQTLVGGSSPQDYAAMVKRFDVDVVVAPISASPLLPVGGYRSQVVGHGHGRFLVIWTGSC